MVSLGCKRTSDDYVVDRVEVYLSMRIIFLRRLNFDVLGNKGRFKNNLAIMYLKDYMLMVVVYFINLVKERIILLRFDRNE